MAVACVHNRTPQHLMLAILTIVDKSSKWSFDDAVVVDAVWWCKKKRLVQGVFPATLTSARTLVGVIPPLTAFIPPPPRLWASTPLTHLHPTRSAQPIRIWLSLHLQAAAARHGLAPQASSLVRRWRCPSSSPSRPPGRRRPISNCPRLMRDCTEPHGSLSIRR